MGRLQRLGVALLWGVNLALRLWHLGSPSTLVFDEVHYVPFAVDYLQHQAFFDVHPPLGKDLIALGIRVFQLFQSLDPTSDPTAGGAVQVAGMALSPVSFRWLNALLGSLMPVTALWVAWTWAKDISLPRRRCFAVLAGLLTSWDGFSLVESRLGLLHPALVGLGLLALGAWGRSRDALTPWPWRLLAGIALGGAIAVKWNGAGYWLVLVLGEVLTRRPWYRRRLGAADAAPQKVSGRAGLPLALPNQGTNKPRRWLWLGWLPLGVYGLLWVPHLHLVGVGFWPIHHTILNAHLGLTDTHRYQSAWFTWPLMIRPIAYFYQGLGVGETLNLIGPTVPNPDRAVALYGMGNPILWWLSTAAVGMGALQVLRGWWPQRRSLAHIAAALRQGQRLSAPTPRAVTSAAALQRLLIMAYAVNWLPWAIVQRSTFLYHYQPAALIAELILAWQMSGWLTSHRRSWQCWGGGLLALIGASFLFWLPLWMGWPLTVEAMGWRWWLPSWI
ncbi:MAG: phospholipid carrier-dependent glycosyltransferase [Cyanobacteria bacterium]|nr:phospholipid carrier-dependent glycosyltransferase [Cyanobacteriota bacterium]